MDPTPESVKVWPRKNSHACCIYQCCIDISSVVQRLPPPVFQKHLPPTPAGIIPQMVRKHLAPTPAGTTPPMVRKHLAPIPILTVQTLVRSLYSFSLRSVHQKFPALPHAGSLIHAMLNYMSRGIAEQPLDGQPAG